MSPRSLVIDGIGDASQVLQPRPGFDARALSRYSGEFHSVWKLVGAGMSVQEIVTSGVVSPSHAIVVVRQLLDDGALQFEGGGGEDDVPIVDDSELGALTAEEQELFALQVDLSDLEKRRILVAARTLREGSLYELLGVSPASNPRDVKRAYYNLSKEFHPDRFYNRQLGPYKKMLETIFERAADAVKILSDARTVMPGDRHAASRRRRQLERFAYTARVRVKCTSWDDIHALITLDISVGGVFIVSTHLPGVDDDVALGLQTPDGSTFKVRGVVAFVRTDRNARRLGRRPGFGVRFEGMNDKQKAKVLELVNHARSSLPGFGNPTEVEPESAPASGRRRMARGTGANQAIIGIDLGTSYTSVSATIGGKIRLLRWPDRELSIPSVVSFPSRDSVLVGKAAKARLLTDPNHTVPSAKRLLGRRSSDNEVAGHLAQSAYDISSAADGQVLINMWGEPYAIPQLVGYLLGAAREAAEQSLRAPVDKAVVTVPVSFGPDRIELLRRAGRLAHLDIVEVIDEPSAAALASRFRPDFGGLIGVYDFGGGTFDFSIVDARGGDFRVLATAGDSWLGGDDFDNALADAIAEKFWRVHGVDLRLRAVEWQQLLFESERAKRGLSQLDTIMMSIPEVCRTQQGTVDLKMRLGRDPVNRLWEEPIRRSITTCMQALAMVGLTPQHLSGVYLAGGTTYLPAVRQALQSYFQRPVHSVVPPEFAACLGAGVHAAQLTHRVATTLSNVA